MALRRLSWVAQAIAKPPPRQKPIAPRRVSSTPGCCDKKVRASLRPDAAIVKRVEQHLAYEAKHADSTVTPGKQVNCQCNISFSRETTRDIFDVLIESESLMNDDNTGKWAITFGTCQVAFKLVRPRLERSELICLSHYFILTGLQTGCRQTEPLCLQPVLYDEGL